MLQLAAIIVLGILAQWVAWRTKVPSILPLILIGLLVGPISTYFTPDGCKWIMPQQVDGSNCSFLFPGQLLFYFVSLFSLYAFNFLSFIALAVIAAYIAIIWGDKPYFKGYLVIRMALFIFTTAALLLFVADTFSKDNCNKSF